MPQPSVSVENNFINGFVTDYSTLNFPENACTEIYDCVISNDGSVQRRFGFDFELNSQTKLIDRTNRAVSTYLWKNVAGDGNLTILVLQVGSVLYFYRSGFTSLSEGAISDTVILSPVAGTDSPETVEAQYCDGNGYLIVTHPYCEPLRISYNTDADTLSETTVVLKIRDFEGDATDPNDINARPTSINVAHRYNLKNQGWADTDINGFFTNNAKYPSNSDVMWAFRDANDNLSYAPSNVAKVVSGNSPAPKGSYILSLSDQDRDAISGLSGVPNSTSGSARPSTTAFYAGRVFYSGINYVGFNSKIYFTQIIERDAQYGLCHQVNDPTSEKLFDLLPSDGGVISIPEAGTIYKLTSVPGGLVVNAANGVWFITGSQGIGFIANDYTVQKLSSITASSPTSFVDVGGSPFWWNEEGIWTIITEGNLPQVKSVVQQKIEKFFQTIPPSSKRFARGFFNKIEGTVKWLYRSTTPQDLTEAYEFDRILTFNTKTAAFHLWRPSDSDVKINGIFVSDGIAGSVSAVNVLDASDDQVVWDGDDVVVYTGAASESAPVDKYLVSYPEGNTFNITFAETRDVDLIDWFQYDGTGTSFSSYFISGSKMRGGSMMKFSPCWTRVYSRVEEPVQYQFQGLWDSAVTPSGTGRWSTKQFVSHTDTDYLYANRKLKVRGHGLGLQFRVESVANEPFDIIGWASLNVTKQIP